MRVLRTGQKRCWDSNGKLIVDPKGTGQDGELRKGASPIGLTRFQDNHDGTVTDTLTGLVWLKNANLFGEVPWEQALHSARHLADGTAALEDGSKLGDWRLPNLNEMQSVLDLNNTFGPAIAHDSPFLNLEASNYWTSTSVALAPPLGWFVALGVGPPVFDLKMNSMRLWPVRGRSSRIARTGQQECFDTLGRPVPCGGTGQDGALRMGVAWPEPRFSPNDDGTVTDELTGLVWLRNADAFGRRPCRSAIRLLPERPV